MYTTLVDNLNKVWSVILQGTLFGHIEIKKWANLDLLYNYLTLRAINSQAFYIQNKTNYTFSI